MGEGHDPFLSGFAAYSGLQHSIGGVQDSLSSPSHVTSSAGKNQGVTRCKALQLLVESEASASILVFAGN